MSATPPAQDLETHEKESPSPSRSDPPEHSLPEGGYQAWLTVAGGWMITFCTFGTVQSFGVYQDYYTRFSLSDHPPSDISWIGSVQIFFLFSGGIFSGKLFDDGYFRALLVVGSFILVFSSFMLSLVKPHQYYQNFLAQGKYVYSVGIGVGMGIIFLPSISVTAHYFKKRRGIAMGIILTGSTAGSVINPIVVNNLFQSIGFGWGVRVVAFMNLGLLLTAIFTMKTRLPARNKLPGSKPIDMLGILRDKAYWIAVAGTSITFWGLFVPFFYIQLYAVKNGLGGTISTYSVSILNAGGFFGRTIPMFLSDMWGPFNVIIPIAFLSGCLAFAFLGATSPGGLVAFAILYGFFSGGFLSVSAPLSASFSRDVGEVGTRIGLMTFCASFFLLIGNPISGAILHPPNYIWINPVVFSGVTVLCGSGAMMISRTMRSSEKATQRL